MSQFGHKLAWAITGSQKTASEEEQQKHPFLICIQGKKPLRFWHHQPAQLDAHQSLHENLGGIGLKQHALKKKKIDQAGATTGCPRWQRRTSKSSPVHCTWNVVGRWLSRMFYLKKNVASGTETRTTRTWTETSAILRPRRRLMLFRWLDMQPFPGNTCTKPSDSQLSLIPELKNAEQLSSGPKHALQNQGAASRHQVAPEREKYTVETQGRLCWGFPMREVEDAGWV